MLEKIKSLPYKQINFALVAFACFMAKMLLISASFPDAIILAVLGASYSYSQYLKRFQPYKLDDAVAKDLLEMRSTLSRLNMIRVQDKADKGKYF